MCCAYRELVRPEEHAEEPKSKIWGVLGGYPLILPAYEQHAAPFLRVATSGFSAHPHQARRAADGRMASKWGVPIGCCGRFVVMGVGTGEASVGGEDGDD